MEFRLVYADAVKVNKKESPDSPYIFLQIHNLWTLLWTTPLSPLSPPASEVGGVRKAKLRYLHLQQDGNLSLMPSLFTCALWLLMPARHEKIIGESGWGAALPTKDSHLSGDNEKTSATWPRGMFTAPGIAPSDASSLGWRTICYGAKDWLKPVSRPRPEHLLRPGQHIVLHRLLLAGDEVGRMKKDFSRGDNWEERQDVNVQTRRTTLVDSSPIVVVANGWHLIWICNISWIFTILHSFRRTSPKT